MFDLEYIFLQLRAKSKGETLDLTFKCPKCELENIVKVDLNKVNVKTNKKHTNKIILQDDIGMITVSYTHLTLPTTPYV